MLRSNTLARAALAALLVAPILGCSDSTSPGSARLSILLKDAPGPIKGAVVTISEIYLQGEGGKLVLSNQATTTDLLTLANDTKTLVDNATIPTGTYSELRFVITGGYIEVQDDAACDPALTTCSTSIYASAGYATPSPAAGELQMPSFGQSGLKVTLPGGALTVTGDQKVLLVDFDVSQSFGQQAGASGQWTMHPVLTATDFALTGSVHASLGLGAGVTLPVVSGVPVTLADFSAVLTASDNSALTLPLTDGDGDGVFEADFRFLAPGSYQVSFTTAPNVQFTANPAVPLSVTVLSGQEASAAATVTSATAP